MSKEAKYEKIYLIRYNNGERNFKHERTVFDYYQIEELMGEKRTNELILEFLKKAKLDTSNLYVDITKISFNALDIDNELNKLANEIYKHSETVSGDDDTYDYFPDLIYAFEQICESLKQDAFYNKVVLKLNKILEYDEDDELKFVTH